MTPLRARLSVALPLLATCAVFAIVKEIDSIKPWWQHALVDATWGLFSLGAALACLSTARTVHAPSLRRAWQFFGAGCFAWFLGIVEWSRLELVTGWLNPFPSVTDAFFLAMPVFFVCGMASLRRERRTRTLSLLQASNVGLAMVGAAIAITLALSPAFHIDDALHLGNVVIAANVVL